MKRLIGIMLVAVVCISSVACQRGRPIVQNGSGAEESTAAASLNQLSSDVQKLQRVFAALS